MQFWCFSVVPKYLKLATNLRGLFPDVVFLFSPVFFLQGMNTRLVVSEFNSTPVSLLESNKVIDTFLHATTVPSRTSGSEPPHYRVFAITLRYTPLGKTPLYEWSARRRDLRLTTHNSHKRHDRGGIRPRNPSKPAAAEPRLRPRGHVYQTS